MRKSSLANPRKKSSSSVAGRIGVLGSVRRKSASKSAKDDGATETNNEMSRVNSLLDQLRESSSIANPDDDIDATLNDLSSIEEAKGNAKRRQETLRVQLKLKQAKMYKLTEAEGDCLSRLSAIDMAMATYRRYTLSGRPASAMALTDRVRVQSGVYGFKFDGDDEDDDDYDEFSSDSDEDRIMSPRRSPNSVSPTGSTLKVKNDGDDGRKSERGSPRTPRKSMTSQHRGGEVSQAELQRRRRLSTTRAATRPSDIPGNRAVKITRSTPGESLGFILKTVKVAKLDKSGLPSGEYVDPTFIDEVDVTGLGYKYGLRAGDHILEIDGINCQLLKHDFVVRHLQRNDGTIQMIVRYTNDFRRSVLYRRLIARRTLLAQKCEMLEHIEGQMSKLEAELSEAPRYLSPSQPPSQSQSPTRTPSTLCSPLPEEDARSLESKGNEEDLCTVDISNPNCIWHGQLDVLVRKMQQQWQLERDTWRSIGDINPIAHAGGHQRRTARRVEPANKIKILGDGSVEDDSDTDVDVDLDVEDTNPNMNSTTSPKPTNQSPLRTVTTLPPSNPSQRSQRDGDDDEYMHMNDSDDDGVSDALTKHLDRRSTMASTDGDIRDRTPSVQSLEVARRTSNVNGRIVLALDLMSTPDDEDEEAAGPRKQRTDSSESSTDHDRSTSQPIPIAVPMPNFPAPDLVLQSASPPHFPAPLLPKPPK